MSKTYLLFGDEKQGPFSEEEVRAMVSAGKISRQTLHWAEGMPEWKPLGSRADQQSGPVTIAPPRRPKDTSLVVDFKDTLRNRKDLSARSKPITAGKAIALVILFFIVLTGMIEIFGRLLPDAAAQFTESVKKISAAK